MENTITILLVGETGVGKSTFINAFVNYLSFNTIKDAINDMKCLIPTQFVVHDMKDGKLKKVYFGEPDPENEGTDSTQSCTKNCKCYTFKFEGFTLKIIDTPGIGDTNGVINDNINMRNLLAFISHYKEINAICVLLKPNNARVSIVFEYCILQILAHLNKSAQDNIIFIFTNARSTFYEPGDTAPALTKILDEVKSKPPNVEIKFDANTTYCLDNEAFRYLVAVSEPNNIEFDPKFRNCFEESWKRSVTECERMLSYIKSLKPHLVEDTITINNIRQKIILLQKPIGDIAKNISDEIRECEKRKIEIHEFVGNIEELKKELFIPTFYVFSTPLEKPMTVCTDPECREEITINGETTYDYKSICHNPCYLKQRDGNILGDTGLLDCQVFNKYASGEPQWWDHISDAFMNPDHFSGLSLFGRMFGGEHSQRIKSEICFKCGHSFNLHMYCTYETKTVCKQIRDEIKFKQIVSNEEFAETQKAMIAEIEERISELKNESKLIADICAEFACFLKKNALTPYNDALEGYIKYLIDNQKSKDNTNQIMETLKQYQKEKEVILNAMEREDSNSDRITTEKINEKFAQLFNLKNYGKVIKDNFEIQKSTQSLIHTSKDKEFNIKPGMGSKLFANLKNIGSSLKNLVPNVGRRPGTSSGCDD